MKLNKTAYLLALTSVVFISGCVTTGKSGFAAGGSVAGAKARPVDGLEQCKEPLGTLALSNDRESEWFEFFNQKTKIQTIEPLIRLTVMQSNCFVVTATSNQHTENKIASITQKQRTEEYRSNSNQQAGQRVAVDYLLETSIILDDQKVSGVKGSLVGSMFAFGGSTDKNESVVTMSLFDIRSGVQLSMSEGNSSSRNFKGGLGIFDRKGSATLSGYSRTPEGKATVAAFVSAYNSMVVSLREYQTQKVKGGLGTGGILKVAD